MKFKNGMFGACLVTLTLLTTVLAGYILSVDRDVITVNDYEYVTDISGLFDYTDAPEYVQYNPSTNYTGYTADFNDWPGTPVYTESSNVNQYRFIKTPGTVTTVTDTLDYTDTFTSGFADDSTYNVYRLGTWTGTTYNFGSPTTITFGQSQDKTANFIANNRPNNTTELPNIVKLTPIINKWVSDNNLSNYVNLDIDLSYGDAPVMFYTGSWDWSQSWVGVPINSVMTFYEVADLDESDCLPTHLNVDLASMTVKGTRGNTVIFDTSTDNVKVIYDYNWNNTGTMAQADASLTATISATTQPTYSYMDPTKGVKLEPTLDNPYSNKRCALNWTNGYSNNTVTLKFLVTENENTTLYILPNTNTPTTALENGGINILGTYSGILQVKYYNGATNVYQPLGKWPACQITLYGSTGQVAFTPTTDINLMSTVEENANTFYVSDVFTPGDIENIIFTSNIVTTGFNAPIWGITNTTVFLDTYNTVMYDPSLDITDYFDFDNWRVNFYAFATYGDTITINNQIMNVDRSNATLTFTDINGAQRTAKLTNLYVTTEDVDGVDHTKITFVGIGSYDLGETVDTTVSFGGLWYFTSAIYRGYESTQTVYNWDLDGAFHADAGECLVIFLGVIGAGVVVARGFAGVNIRVLDWVIIGFTVFGALVYFGGLI